LSEGEFFSSSLFNYFLIFKRIYEEGKRWKKLIKLGVDGSLLD
jgi:hypothetical protein